MERPNTIAGLKAKHAELTKLRADHEAEVRKLTCELDHLDACIRLFDPEADVRRVKHYVTKHRAKKGQSMRFVLGCLRDASGPLTSREIAEAWAADRGLRADDATLVILRKRVGACLKAQQHRGLVHSLPYGSGMKAWALLSSDQNGMPANTEQMHRSPQGC